MDTNGLNSNSQNQRFHIGLNAHGGEDRLSNLSEPLVNHIMSFLPTKDVVRTSVLSTKWKYMWTVVTNLHFDDGLPNSRKRMKNKKAKFMHFVERVLLLGGPVIENFHLSCSDDYDASRVHSWISTAIRRNVRKLTISHFSGESSVFPHCLYDSDSLTDLELRMNCTFNVLTTICFSSLKSLRLYHVTFSCSNELHFGFPLLEVLCLYGCSWQKVKAVNIDAPKLNSCTINIGQPITMSDFVVKIHGSSLKFFFLDVYSFVDFSLPSQSSVIHAAIRFTNIKDKELKMGLLTCKLLRQFSNLKCLTLSCQTIAALAYIEDLQDHLRMNTSLIKLTIWATFFRGTHVLGGKFIALLQSMPVLESLIFNKGLSWLKNDELGREVVPPCFQTHLKFVKFEYFDIREHGLELAKFFLKNAVVLEEMNITAGGSFLDLVVVKEQLIAFPRGSDHASITFNKVLLFMS